MAVTKRRKKTTVGTKQAIVFSILDQQPDITVDEALKELKRRKVPMGKRAKQNYYSMKTLWNKRGGNMKRSYTKRRKRKAQPTEQLNGERETQLRLLQTENERLKAVIAVLLR